MHYMKQYFLIAAAAVLLAACNNSQQTSSESADTSALTTVNADEAPVMKFVNDVYDFGKVKDGEKVAYDFEFLNEGKSPLIIANVSATCGCTVPERPTEPIPSGGKGKISVVFNSSGKVGLQDRIITITANTIPAETHVRLIGEVIK